MSRRRTVAARCRRSLVAAACSGLVAVAALATAGPPASGSSLHPGSARTDFEPRSVTFVSLDTGWVLGTAPCAAGGRCLALEETIDAGRSWSARPLPTALLAAADRKVDGVPAELAPCCGGLNIRFANRRDGWIYGGLTAAGRLAGSTEPILWSTHDGGEVWRQQALPGLSDESPIFDVEAAGGMVYLMAPNDAEGVTVESSPVSEDSWHVSNAVRLGDPAGGSMQSGAFVPPRIARLAGRGQRSWHHGQRGACQRRPMGEMDASLCLRRPHLRDPGCLNFQRPRRDLRDGWLRLPVVEERSPRGNRRVELALLLEKRRANI